MRSFVEQQTRRQPSLVTPITFGATIGATSTALYTVPEDEYLLIRKVVAVNDTGGAVDVEVTVDGSVYAPSANILAGEGQEVSILAGMLIEPEAVIAATGNGVRVFGWGVRVQGGDGWTL